MAGERKVGIGQGDKGRKAIRVSKLCKQTCTKNSLAKARAIRHGKSIETPLALILDGANFVTPEAVNLGPALLEAGDFVEPVDTTQKRKYKKQSQRAGVPLHEFIDWRNFGAVTYQELVDSGILTLLDNKISAYKNKHSITAKHKAIVSTDLLPLSI